MSSSQLTHILQRVRSTTNEINTSPSIYHPCITYLRFGMIHQVVIIHKYHHQNLTIYIYMYIYIYIPIYQTICKTINISSLIIHIKPSISPNLWWSQTPTPNGTAPRISGWSWARPVAASATPWVACCGTSKPRSPWVPWDAVGCRDTGWIIWFNMD